MEFSISRLYVKVEIMKQSPFELGKVSKRRLAERISAEADLGSRSPKFARIKALRRISIDTGWYETFGFGLRESKNWVEQNFADNGAGEIAL